MAQIDIKMKLNVQLIIIGIGYTYLTIMAIITYSLELFSLLRFVKIVRKAGSAGHLNTIAISIQILGLFIWTTVWIAEAILYLQFYRD